jgi:hypothetical protein
MNFRSWCVGLLWAASVGGCAHYNLGSGAPPPFHSLYVPPVRNNSFAPQAQATLSDQVRQSLLQEGTFTLANPADADAKLDIVVTDYKPNEAATSLNNTLNASSYTLTLTVECTLTDLRSGKVYFKNRPISASVEAFVQGGNDFSEAEYQAMPNLARALALQIKDTLVGTW